MISKTINSRLLRRIIGLHYEGYFQSVLGAGTVLWSELYVNIHSAKVTSLP